MLLKYRPEDKAAKKEHLINRAQAESEGKTSEEFEAKKPIVVSMVIEQNKAQLVVVAHDVNPIELVVWFPALCRIMEIPYCIVQGKARLEEVVHKKTVSGLCLTTVKHEDKMELSKILEAINSIKVVRDPRDCSRLSSTKSTENESLAKTKAKEKVLVKEAAQRMNYFQY